MLSHNVDRRAFGKISASTALAMGAARAADSPNDRLSIGFVGVGNRGSQLLDGFLAQPDIKVVALCDVYQPYLDRAQARFDNSVETCRDFRQLIDRPDVDVVVIATPDHWHAIQTIAACDAGKDVYVEKPLSITIVEGRRMVEAARRNNRVVQVGTHRRSSELYPQLAQLIAAGRLGKITVSRCYRLSNMFPNGIGREQPGNPPTDLDWNLWLGPRPLRKYQANIAPYKFRWWQQYSSQMGNWGVHYLDAIRWLTDDLAPASVCAMGGRFAVDDDRTVPDTMEVTYQFSSGRLAIFGQYEANGAAALKQGEVELRGTQGTAYIGGKGFDVFPERGGQFQDRKPRMQRISVASRESNAALTSRHVRNFLDSVRSRDRPNADVEIGHRSTTMSLLANISLAVGARLEWDAQRERITNHKSANDLLHYEYRKPWKLG
ncbi:MAG: Gfo/Idh/MocA family protein [Pirellulales bacterium]